MFVFPFPGHVSCDVSTFTFVVPVLGCLLWGPCGGVGVV